MRWPDVPRVQIPLTVILRQVLCRQPLNLSIHIRITMVAHRRAGKTEKLPHDVLPFPRSRLSDKNIG